MRRSFNVAQKLSGLISDPDAHFGPNKNPNGVLPQGGLRLTVYSSPDDKGLGLSTFLCGSAMRLGQQTPPKVLAQSGASEAPSGSVNLHVVQVGFIGGVSKGDGVLHYQGRETTGS